LNSSDIRVCFCLQFFAIASTTQRKEAEMHLHLVHDAVKPQPQPRPAKVVQLDARREARLVEAKPLERPRPAA
jgi:hypothetical protein